MTDTEVPQTDRVALRRRAEDSITPAGSQDASTGQEQNESLKLIHELQVHKIELEMQNRELRQTRNQLEKALERYTDLYDYAPVGYVTLDSAGVITVANLTSAFTLGVARSRLIGRRFEQFIPAETRRLFAEFLAMVFASQTKEACEIALLKEGDSRLHVQLEAVSAPSGRECRIALIDKTEHRRVEEALRQQKEASEALHQAKEAAEATDRAKSLFLASMSHELRNPMTVILAMLQLTLREELTPELREHQEMAHRSARSLLRILNDILDMARIEAGKLSIEEEPFSLPLCLSEVVDTFAADFQRKGLACDLLVAEGLPVTVVGDRARLQQVLSNLIGNAVKFTEEGKVTVLVASTAQAPDGREYTFTVTDTGIGIPDEKKELLFRTFSQLDSSHSRRYGGTGLGLSICRELVGLMGGTVSCSSAEGRGSSFSFTIPLREAGSGWAVQCPAGPPIPGWAPAPGGGKIPRILLAEDDPGNRKAFGALFKMSNYHVEFAEDGLQAVEMWEQGGFDLLLMDIQMPRLNGFEATGIIRQKEKDRGGHIPIVALTAHAFKEDVEKCLATGMDDYISKPIDIDAFLIMIGGILNK